MAVSTRWAAVVVVTVLVITYYYLLDKRNLLNTSGGGFGKGAGDSCGSVNLLTISGLCVSICSGAYGIYVVEV